MSKDTENNNQVFRVVINDNDEIDVSYEDDNSQDGEAADDYIVKEVDTKNENNNNTIEMECISDENNDYYGSEEEEIVEHVCKKCDKTFLDLNDLRKHLPFCRHNSAANLHKQEMYANLKNIEKECLQMEIADLFCYCCEENFDSCHAGHIRCPECPKSFKNSNSFQRHVFLVHSDSEEFSCDICNARCPSDKILKIHTEHHQKRGKPFACKKCGKEFTRRYHVLRHTKYSGCDAISSKKEFECNVCNKVFYRIDNLRSHLRTHLGEDTKTRDYQCPYCDKSFYGTSTLNIHIRTHTGERPFPCDLCPKVFPSNAALRKHRRYHTGEKPYECSICSRSFTAKEVLNRHVKTHTGERPHSCDICGKSFIQATQLKNHLKNHLQHHSGNGKRFECALCDQKFNRKSKLTKHLIVDHSSTDVEFKCRVCMHTFKSSAGLKRHITRKHSLKIEELFMCVICDEQFTDAKSLNFHRLTHTDEDEIQSVEDQPEINKNQCSVCSEVFKTAIVLQSHMKRTHRNEINEDVKPAARILNSQSPKTQPKPTEKVVKTINGEVIAEYMIDEIPDDVPDNSKRLVIYEESGFDEKKMAAIHEESDDDNNDDLMEYDIVEQNEKNNHDDDVDDDEEGEILMTLETDSIKSEKEYKKAKIEQIDDENFNKKIHNLLSFLVDGETLKKFGWPDSEVEDVLRKVILNCGHKFSHVDISYDYITRMREYVKLLFTVVVDNDSIKELLNNLTIDEVIEQVISMAD